MSAASAAAHELRKHQIHRYRVKRIRQLGPGAFHVESTKRVLPSMALARLAVDGVPDGSIHSVSGGLPTLGKRR